MRHLRNTVAGMLGVALVAPVVSVASVTPAAAQAAPEQFDVLVVGKTIGFRHSSIDEATTAIMALGQANGFTVDVWDPPTPQNGNWRPSPGQPERTLPSTPFTATGLAKYETVVFVSTVDGTNDQNPTRPTLLDASELAAFQGYIRNGGGFAGIHAATDSMHSVPWYGELTGGGARFRNHPAIQNATLRVEDPTHPSTAMLPRAWERRDEWYNFTANPRASVHTLITLDESTYTANAGRDFVGAMGDDHPISWCHNFEGARSWYEGGGHTEASYTEPLFLAHILKGIQWSAGAVGTASDCVAFKDVAAMFERLVADDRLAEHVAFSILDRVEHAQRWAEAGSETRAVAYLRQAIARANNQIKGDADDRAVRADVRSLLEDLVQWQRDVDEPRV